MNGVKYIIILEVLIINYLEKIQIAKQRKYTNTASLEENTLSFFPTKLTNCPCT